MSGSTLWLALPWIAIFLAALAVWFPRLRAFSLGACALGYAGGFLTGQLAPIAIGPLALLAAAAYLVRPGQPATVRVSGHLLFVVLAVALTLHWLPGFHNPRVIGPERFTPDAVPFTMYLNFDKPLVGFWLMWVLPWLRPDASCGRSVRVGLVAALVTSAACLTFALTLGMVGWAPKWPALGWLWLLNNALLVTFAEEALFRGYLQGGLERLLAAVRGGRAIALALAAVAFGAAHLAGGWPWAVLGTVAGVGYGLAYRHGGLRAAVLAHLGLNVIHFTLFTYPMLQAAR
jgi:uncharacterized protein